MVHLSLPLLPLFCMPPGHAFQYLIAMQNWHGSLAPGGPHSCQVLARMT